MSGTEPDGLPWRLARRIGLFLAGWVTLWWLVAALFLAGIVPGGWWTLAVLLVLALAPIGVVMRGFAGVLYPSAAMRVGVIRPFLYVFLLLPFVAIATLLGALAGLPFGEPIAGGRWALGGTALLLTAVAVLGYGGSKRLVVRHVEIEHPDLPAPFDGLRIAQLSDHHVGPHTSRAFLARIAREVERARPDVIVHTGDQVDDYDQDVEHFVGAFGHLDAPLGVYAIAGNHDIYAGWAGVREGLAAAGIRVLVNESVSIERDGAILAIAGTGDPAASQWGVEDPAAPAPDLDATMRDVPQGAFSLVLAHNPALWPGLARRGAHVTLSGHTHHGQLSIPALRWSLASLFLEHAMGRYDDGASVLYINPGTNHWGLPLRIGAWPEVTIVTLSRAG